MASQSPRQPSRLAPLLRLPIELRQSIYSYLLPRENVSHPLPSVGITSVSHRPPTSALLNTHPTITDEILDHFYAISTWKLVFSHAFNFFRIDPELRRLEQSPSLRRMRRVEVVFFCDVLLLRDYPSFGLANFCAEIERRAARACDVLARGAPRLRQVTVSWVDTTDTGSWADKARVLRPLRSLLVSSPHRAPSSSTVTFCIGEINGPRDVDREAFVETMKQVLGTEHVLDTMGLDGSSDEPPSSLRMLAFDVRQARHEVYGQPGVFPTSTWRRTGWRGAPPALATAVEEGH